MPGWLAEHRCSSITLHFCTQSLETIKVLGENREVGRKWGGGLAYDVSSSQAAQDFGTSPPCDGEDLVSIAATARFPPLFLSGTCIPQMHGSYISPQGFHFPAARFCRAPAGLPFSAFFQHWFGESGGGGLGDAVQASLSPPSPS